ncbi:MAG: hypothetical protein WDO69_27170 [Pseudomonadota bacterium]
MNVLAKNDLGAADDSCPACVARGIVLGMRTSSWAALILLFGAALCSCAAAKSDADGEGGTGGSALGGGPGAGGTAEAAGSSGEGGAIDGGGEGGTGGAGGSGEDDVPGPLVEDGVIGPVTLHIDAGKALLTTDVMTQMTGDAAGDLWLFFDHAEAGQSIEKHDAKLELEWTLDPIHTVDAEPVRITGIASTPAGELLITGGTPSALPGQTAAGGEDIFVGKFAPDQTPSFLKQFGSDSDEKGELIALGGDGSFAVAGSEAGPLLGGGQGRDYGGPFVVQYAADGTRTGTLQTSDFGQGLLTLVVDSERAFYATRAYVDSNYPVDKYATDGTLLWSYPDTYSQPRKIAVTSRGKYVYLFGGGQGSCTLEQLAADGTLRWTRKGSSTDTDGAHGYHGEFNGCGPVVASETAVYVAGSTLSLSFDGGEGGAGGNANEDQGGNALFVARFDSNGNQIWYRQIALTADATMTPVALVLDAAGNPVLGSQDGAAGLISKLHAKDGSSF